MWLTFAAACLASVVVLYAPGYFAGRAVRLDSLGAIAVAPAFSVALLVAMGVLLQVVGVSCPAWALFLAVLLFSLVVCGVSRFIFPKHDASASNGVLKMGGLEWKVVGLYIGISLLVFCIVFVHAMADPYGFCRLDDSAAHYTLIRSFLDTGFIQCSAPMGTPLWVARVDTTRRFGMVLLPLWRHCLGILWHLRRTL